MIIIDIIYIDKLIIINEMQHSMQTDAFVGYFAETGKDL